MSIELEIERTKLKIELKQLDLSIEREKYVESVSSLSKAVIEISNLNTLQDRVNFFHDLLPAHLLTDVNKHAKKYAELQYDLDCLRQCLTCLQEKTA